MHVLAAAGLAMLGGLGGLGAAPAGAETPPVWRLEARPQAAAPVSGVDAAQDGRRQMRIAGVATLYTPSGYRAGERYPLVLLLHGAGGDGRGMVARFRSYADDRGLVLLAPDSKGRSWDLITGARRTPQGFRPGDPGEDVARIDRALAETFATHAIDPERIGVLGISDGASYALTLGAHNTELFSAAMALSPGMVSELPAATGRIYVAHGRRDRVLDYSVTESAIVPMLREAGFAVTFAPFQGGHEWSKALIDAALDWWLAP
ncbi:MAG: PHB depolymerase family esterase [Hyphomonadaceae bacterium]